MNLTLRRPRAAGPLAIGLTLLALLGPERTFARRAEPPVVVVVQKVANSLGLYDSVTGSLIWTAAVGVRPHELVLSAGERYAYVTDYGVGTYTDPAEGGHTVSIVYLRKGERVGVVDLGRFRRPHGIALGFSGRVYVTVDHPAAVLEIDTVNRHVAAEHLLDQALPHMVVVSRDEQTLFTANAGAGTASRIDRRPDGQVRSVTVGGVPMGLALSRDGTRLYVATSGQNTVVVVDTASLEVVDRLTVTGAPARVRLTPDDKFLLVTLIGSGQLAVIGMATGREVARLEIGAAAEGLTIDTRSGFGYASAQGANRMVKFSLTDWRPVLEIATGSSPDPMEVFQRSAAP